MNVATITEKEIDRIIKGSSNQKVPTTQIMFQNVASQAMLKAWIARALDKCFF